MTRRRAEAASWGELLAAAQEASGRAYAPYSHLRIGAALAEARPGGRVFAGCNVEISSFGLTLCAERVALVRAVAEAAREFERLVVYTPDAGPLAPCGACRQALWEFCAELEIVSIGRGQERREFRLRELLPEAFGWPAGEEGEGAEPSFSGAG